MKCSEARPLLDPLCDGALDAKDAALVLDHLKACSECDAEWRSLEDLRARFKEAKGATQIPAGLMDRISLQLKKEEKSEKGQLYRQYARVLPMVAIAAGIVLVGLFVLPMTDKVNARRAATQSASADVLVNDLLANRSLETVSDRGELAKRVGFDLRYLPLPEWQMDRSGVYRTKGNVLIARFDFQRKGESGAQHLTCYQAPEGLIRAERGTPETIDRRRVWFGSQDKVQYALWSQNGRDYLFATMLPKEQLEAIVRGT